MLVETVCGARRAGTDGVLGRDLVGSLEAETALIRLLLLLLLWWWLLLLLLLGWRSGRIVKMIMSYC